MTMMAQSVLNPRIKVKNKVAFHTERFNSIQFC